MENEPKIEDYEKLIPRVKRLVDLIIQDPSIDDTEIQDLAETLAVNKIILFARNP